MITPEEAIDRAFFWAVAALGGIIVWIGARLHSRVDALEQTKVDKAALDDFKKTMSEHRDETRASFERIDNTLSHVNATLLQIVQRLPK